MSKVRTKSAVQEYFGVCQSSSDSRASPTQLLRKNRRMVAKLRSISDSSSWMDEKKSAGFKNIGWGEVARGWQPVKPYPAIIATSAMKKLTREAYQQTELRPNETLSVKLHWRDIIKYTNDVVKPNLLSQPLTSRKTQLGLNNDSKLLDKNRLQKVSENHSTVTKKLQQILNNRDLKFENNKQLEIKKKMRVPLDNQSLKKADRLAKLLRKLPRVQQQIKRNNKTVKRLSPSKSPTKNRLNQTSRINIEYGSPVSTSKRILPPIQPHAAKTRDGKRAKASPKKLRQTSNQPTRSGEIAVKALELKTQMCLHVILPSIESKPETHLEYKKFATQNLNFKKETDSLSLRHSTPVSILSKDADFRESSALSRKVNEENYNWKFLPFLPPVLKQEDKTVQKWKGRRKPNTNLVAITQAAAKAGVSSNSISKLQRATLNGVTMTRALPITAFTVNSHTLISEELATKS